MLKSCGARGVGMARLPITVDEDKLERARTPRAGGLPGKACGLFVDGIESLFA
jgi:hypothetical protein